ncbi:hypothetical protein T439DRAFT_382980 [Meredithblackwellia eburnea MCA 4105]
MTPQSSLTRLLPTPTTFFLFLILRTFSQRQALKLSKWHKAMALVMLANWRSWPFVWHVKLWSLVPAIHLRYRIFGVDKTFAIAQDPFEKVVISKDYVSVDQGDWNGHMSNTSYGKSLDAARFKWLLELVGPAMGPEGIWSPLGATAFTFIKEIPMWTPYNIEVSVVSWDEKWIYYQAKFTTAAKRKGQPRTVHCIALSRSCFKLRTSRLTIPPSRVLSLSGVGASRSNWNRTLQLRKEGKSKAWLKYGGEVVAARKSGGDVPPRRSEWDEEGLDVFEERRVRNLREVSGAFGDVGRLLEA